MQAMHLVATALGGQALPCSRQRSPRQRSLRLVAQAERETDGGVSKSPMAWRGALLGALAATSLVGGLPPTAAQPCAGALPLPTLAAFLHSN